MNRRLRAYSFGFLPPSPHPPFLPSRSLSFGFQKRSILASGEPPPPTGQDRESGTCILLRAYIRAHTVTHRTAVKSTHSRVQAYSNYNHANTRKRRRRKILFCPLVTKAPPEKGKGGDVSGPVPRLTRNPARTETRRTKDTQTCMHLSLLWDQATRRGGEGMGLILLRCAVRLCRSLQHTRTPHAASCRRRGRDGESG